MKEDLFQLIAGLQNSLLLSPPHTQPFPLLLQRTKLRPLIVKHILRQRILCPDHWIHFLGYLCPLKTSPDCTSKDLLPGKTSSNESSSWMKPQQGHWLQVTHPSVFLHSYMHHTHAFRIVWRQTKHLCKALKTVPIHRLLSLCKFYLKLSFSFGDGMRHLVSKLSYTAGICLCVPLTGCIPSEGWACFSVRNPIIILPASSHSDPHLRDSSMLLRKWCRSRAWAIQTGHCRSSEVLLSESL